VLKFLQACFGSAELVFTALQPDDVRHFIAEQLIPRATSAKANSLASALRAYFRYRSAGGNAFPPELPSCRRGYAPLRYSVRDSLLQFLKTL